MLCLCVFLVPVLTALTATLLLPPAKEDTTPEEVTVDVDLYTGVHVALVALSMVAAIFTPDVWQGLGQNVARVVGKGNGGNGKDKAKAKELLLVLDLDDSDYSIE